MLRLPDVTLVAVDTAYHALTERAVQDCVDKVDFADVFVLSDRKVGPSAWRWAPFFGKSAAEAEQAIWYKVPELVETSHFLWVQWDSWVVHPRQWTDDFLKYDYVGAPWWYTDGLNVGNGGFSLRSTKLMHALAARRANLPFRQPEDDVLCRRYRFFLEQLGFRWAHEGLAHKFSIERTGLIGQEKTFGFHGMFNWPRYLTRKQIAERVALAPASLLRHPHYKEMRRQIDPSYVEEYPRVVA